MSIPTQTLRYGWVVLAMLSITGGTIFVADNVMRRITTATRIEIILGTFERCLGTQTGTNALGEPVYAVDPPIIEQVWVTNSYSTQVVDGVTSVVAVAHANIMTNAIGWRDDIATKNTLDAKIKALVPHYIDTNSLFDGATNIVFLTVTGLWASLGIGDRTNQFTQTPAWTDTNGVLHAATFGPWAWRNYVLAWEERYKVLNACKLSLRSPVLSNTYLYGISDYGWGVPWEDAKQQADDRLSEYMSVGWPESSTRGGLLGFGGLYYATKTIFTKLHAAYFGSQLAGNIKLYVSLTNIVATWRYDGIPPYDYFIATNTAPYDVNGTENIIPGSFYEWGHVAVESGVVAIIERDVSVDASPWCDIPPGGGSYSSASGRGFAYKDSKSVFAPTFFYCTNKYW